jgi:SagB-type dehydrogenase family enzyme
MENKKRHGFHRLHGFNYLLVFCCSHGQNPQQEVPVKYAGGERSNKQGIGERFQEETKYAPDAIGGHYLDWNHMPDPYKNYPESNRKVALPELRFGKSANLWEIIYKRRSLRNYSSDRLLSMDILSALLWATQGITAAEAGYPFRVAPSAGGLYPIETYLLARAVEGLDMGLYHFRPNAFDLEFIKAGDFARPLAEAALGQGMVANAQVSFIWTAVVARSKWKYRQRAYRYIYLDAGHIAQNLYLAGTATGLGVCSIGAFYDDQVNAIIGVDGVEETALYLASVGWSTKHADE